MRQEEEKKTRGGWNQKLKRRRWKPMLFRTVWKASTWTLMVKVSMQQVRVNKKHRRQSDAPGVEGEEVKSPKRKVTRVESEETQDYVRETNDRNQEEAEEISFVPSAISVPQKPLFRCDNRCSEKTLSVWQALQGCRQVQAPRTRSLERALSK